MNVFREFCGAAMKEQVSHQSPFLLRHPSEVLDNYARLIMNELLFEGCFRADALEEPVWIRRQIKGQLRFANLLYD